MGTYARVSLLRTVQSPKFLSGQRRCPAERTAADRPEDDLSARAGATSREYSLAAFAFLKEAAFADVLVLPRDVRVLGGPFRVV